MGSDANRKRPSGPSGEKVGSGGGYPGRPHNPVGHQFQAVQGSGDRLGDPPSWLSEPAQQIWRRAVTELAADDLDQARFGDMLELWCNAIVYARKAAEVLDKAGPLIVRRREGITNVVSSPAAREFDRMAKICRMMATEYGFTPSAAARLDRTFTAGDLVSVAGDDDAAAEEAEVISILQAARQRAKAAREAATGQQQ